MTSNERELATLSRRVRYASKVIQEATQQDPLFDAVYHSSLNHDGVGLCGILHDLHDRLYAKECEYQQRIDLIERLAQAICDVDGATLADRPHYRYVAQRLIDAGWGEVI